MCDLPSYLSVWLVAVLMVPMYISSHKSICTSNDVAMSMQALSDQLDKDCSTFVSYIHTCIQPQVLYTHIIQHVIVGFILSSFHRSYHFQFTTWLILDLLTLPHPLLDPYMSLYKSYPLQNMSRPNNVQRANGIPREKICQFKLVLLGKYITI